jgi:hypothetical protein
MIKAVERRSLSWIIWINPNAVTCDLARDAKGEPMCNSGTV